VSYAGAFAEERTSPAALLAAADEATRFRPSRLAR
jgi:hypothetical protein